jgi:DNA-binding transcriptional regulator LsrR (DeoR family)
MRDKKLQDRVISAYFRQNMRQADIARKFKITRQEVSREIKRVCQICDKNKKRAQLKK